MKAIRNADRQRTLYLDREQRRALLEKVDDEAERFVRALCLLPLRPGAVASLTAGNFEERTSELTITEAVIAAELPSGTTANTLRHSTITDLVNGGLPLLAVAQISNTSAEMSERHYGHLSRHAVAEALASLAL